MFVANKIFGKTVFTNIYTTFVSQINYEAYRVSTYNRWWEETETIPNFDPNLKTTFLEI